MPGSPVAVRYMLTRTRTNSTTEIDKMMVPPGTHLVIKYGRLCTKFHQSDRNMETSQENTTRTHAVWSVGGSHSQNSTASDTDCSSCQSHAVPQPKIGTNEPMCRHLDRASRAIPGNPQNHHMSHRPHDCASPAAHTEPQQRSTTPTYVMEKYRIAGTMMHTAVTTVPFQSGPTINRPPHKKMLCP